MLTLLSGPVATAAELPTAQYATTVEEASPGDAFEVAVDITWAGTPDVFAIAPPRPVEVDGASFALQRSESGQDDRQSFLRFTWIMSVEKAGEYALPDLLPVIARQPNAPEPIKVEPIHPITVSVIEPVPIGRRITMAAIGLFALTGIVIATRAVRRRRTAAASIRNTLAMREQQRVQLESRLQHARKLRLDGSLPAYMEALCDIADACGDSTSDNGELDALRERVTYAHYPASATELDRAETLVRRSLEADANPATVKE